MILLCNLTSKIFNTQVLISKLKSLYRVTRSNFRCPNLLNTLDVPNNTVFWNCTKLGFMPISANHLFNSLRIIPNAPITTKIQFIRIFPSFFNSMTRSLHFVIFLYVSYWFFSSFANVKSVIWNFQFFSSINTKAGLL